MDLDWKALRKQTRDLMMQNGIGGLIVLALKYFASLLIVAFIAGIAYTICTIPAILISGVLGDDTAIVAVVTFIFSLLGIVVFYILLSLGTVGFCNVVKNFVQSGEIKISDVFFGYKNDNKGLIIRTMALWFIKTFLWSLLCYVPGLIYGCKTLFVPYILTENPDMSPKDIINLSKEMTNGFKVNYIVQGIIFLIPYIFLAELLSCCTLMLSAMAASLYLMSVQAAYYLIRLNDFTGSDDDSADDEELY
jgi:uncharacterized membrane protein